MMSCTSEADEVVDDGGPATVVSTVSLDREVELLPPGTLELGAGRREKKVRDGKVVSWSVWQTALPRYQTVA